MEEAEKNLVKTIDDGLMELDYQICQRALRDGVPRSQITIVDLSSQAFAAMLVAFSQDENLWAEFSWEVGAPREPAFERLYQRAHLLEQSKLEPNESLLRQQAVVACDPNGLTRRINVVAGDGQLDGLTVSAVAYVLGRKPALWRAVQAAVQRKSP